ncbi:hypothetical protein FJZ33_00225, partial [Candidatus Poribacteria bacterium]|nr:hypothetical protein [Candidatus Poribacteria bacterium]
MDKAKEQDNFLENISKLPEFFAPKYHTHKEIDIIDLDRMRWKGKWVKDTDYKVNDVVSYQNALYICMTDNKGEKPTSDFWEKLISIIS